MTLSNNGLRSGTSGFAKSRLFMPEIRTAGSGGEIQPYFDPYDGKSYVGGEWSIDEDGIVTTWFQLTTVGATTLGSGSVYVFKLPVKARRWTGFGTTCRIPIGEGMCYWSFSSVFAPWQGLDCLVTLADPYESLAGTEDYYCQLHVPHVLDWKKSSGISDWSGVESWSAGTAYTVTHYLGYTPNVDDISLVATNAGLSLAQNNLFVPSATNTTFTVQNRSAGVPAAQQDFQWKITSEPPAGQYGAVVGPLKPWDWSRWGTGGSGPFGNFFVQVSYEAA